MLIQGPWRIPTGRLDQRQHALHLLGYIYDRYPPEGQKLIFEQLWNKFEEMIMEPPTVVTKPK